MTRFIIALLLCLVPLAAISAERHPETITRQQFEQWFDEVSNWGRWGKDDELGTLNLITPESKVKAAALVKRGVTVSLALDLNKVKSEYNPRPLEHTFSVSTFGSQTFVSDKYAVYYHGSTHSFISGLAHLVRKGKFYNGFPANLTEPDRSGKLGIDTLKDGVFTRGVLVDMAWFRGVDFLEPGDAIAVSELKAWEARTGVTLRSGDALLVRTGRWQRARQIGPSHLIDGVAGLHASVARWLRQRDVAIVGSDGANDVLPSGVEGLLLPFNELAMAGMGMPLLHNLDLDVLADAALKHGRWEFLFVCAPLRVQGGTGAPLNPLAVF